MSSIISININQEEIKTLFLDSIKASIGTLNITNSKNDLETLNADDVRDLLCIGKKALTNLVDAQIIKPITMGNGFHFSLWQIKKFQEDYMGYDLTSYEKCVTAKIEVENKNSPVRAGLNKI